MEKIETIYERLYNLEPEGQLEYKQMLRTQIRALKWMLGEREDI